MERRRLRGGSNTENDMALAKAAAWAWYQRGSMSTNEFISHSNSPREPRPSRYMLEAQRTYGNQVKSASPKTKTVSKGVDSVRLLDEYEIERITLEFNQLAVSEGGEQKRRESGRKVVKRGNEYFWIRHAMRVCSSRGDAVEGKALVRRGGGPRVAAATASAVR